LKKILEIGITCNDKCIESVVREDEDIIKVRVYNKEISMLVDFLYRDELVRLLENELSMLSLWLEKS
jgi:hypothetical protein